MDRCPPRLLLHPPCRSTPEKSVPKAEAAYGLLLRGRMLHLFEVDARVLQLYLEMLFLCVRVLSEGL